ncbi:MAG: hypothetical protein LKI53_07190 [Bacteroidales bacterium]|jgi:hypothetical protein|nr:hypothetical protein [Bacteroidales bacterium]
MENKTNNKKVSNNSSKPKAGTIEQKLQKKRRLVVSYANMSPELSVAFKEKYPKGYSDYLGDIIKIEKPDHSFFYAVSIEIPDAVYLVKIDVTIDDYEDAENGLFGDGESEGENGDSAEDGATFPDAGMDDKNNFSDDDDSN